MNHPMPDDRVRAWRYPGGRWNTGPVPADLGTGAEIAWLVPEGGEANDTFEADTRLLAYFGNLYRAALPVIKTAEAGVSDDEIEALRTATILPPDIEAAVEGPRGRAKVLRGSA